MLGRKQPTGVGGEGGEALGELRYLIFKEMVHLHGAAKGRRSAKIRFMT